MIRVNERWLEYHKAYNVTIEGLGGYTMDQVECRGEGAEEQAGERGRKNELVLRGWQLVGASGGSLRPLWAKWGYTMNQVRGHGSGPRHLNARQGWCRSTYNLAGWSGS